MINSPLVHTPSETAVLDSGTTTTLITSTTKCVEKIPTTKGLRVGIPNGQIMKGSHTAALNPQHLPIPLNNQARQASVQPHLKKALISLGQLCDHGCDYVLLDKHYASVIKDGVTTVIGLRDPATGLWLIDLEKSGPPAPLIKHQAKHLSLANSAYEQKTKVQLIDFLHRACFSPPHINMDPGH
jgi:hypothetical protein